MQSTSHYDSLQEKAHSTCREINAFVQKAREEGKVLNFKGQGIDGVFTQRIANLKCNVDIREGMPTVGFSFDRYIWRMGYSYADHTADWFYPVTPVKTLSPTQILVDSDWYFEQVQPIKLFDKVIW